MAIKEIRRSNNGLGELLSDFVCDNIADIVNMPDITDGVAIGSTLICGQNKKKYILSNAGTWLEVFPDEVFDSLRFFNTVSANADVRQLGVLAFLNADANNRSSVGYYWVANQNITVGSSTETLNVDGVFAKSNGFTPGDEGGASALSVNLEIGDWFILTGISGEGTSGDPYIFDFAVVNNTYEIASTTVNGITRLSSQTVYNSLSGNNVVTDGVLKTVIDPFINGTQTLTDTRITNSANAIVPLIITGTPTMTSNLLEMSFNSANRFTVDRFGATIAGAFITGTGLWNSTAQINAYVNVDNNGTIISRNVNDTNVPLIVRKNLGTGNILELQVGSSDKKFEVDVNGWFYQNGTRLFTQRGSNTNTFFGISSGGTNTTGGDNTAFGMETMGSVQAGSGNTSMGRYSLFALTGSNNTAIGRSSGQDITSGSNNVFVGRDAGNNASQLATVANSTALGYQSFTDKSNQMVFGNASVTEFKFDRNASAIALLPQTQISSANFPPLSVERTTAGIATPSGALRVLATTSGNMTDGFGIGITYSIRDDEGVINNISSITALRSGADNSGRLSFRTIATGTETERMTILPNGNVGIGTESPATTFVVATPTNDDGLQIRRNSATTNDYATLGFRVQNSDSSVNFAEIRALRTNRAVNTDTDLIFITRSNNSNTEKMRIRDDGNVGIGTESPARILEISSPIGKESYLRISGFPNNEEGANFAGIEFFNTDASDVGPNVAALIEAVAVNSFGVGANLIFGTTTVGSAEGTRASERMRITHTGLVGINETDPTAQLQVKSGATNRVPLIVDIVASNTASLTEWNRNGVVVARLDSIGGGRFPNVSAVSTGNDAQLALNSTGSTISRNIADTNPALIVNLQNAGATGNIQVWQFGGNAVSQITNNGVFVGETRARQTEQTGDYTLALTDEGKVLRVNSGSNRTITIPKNSVTAFPVDTEITILRMGSGTVSIAPVDGDVTLNSASNDRKIKDQYGSAKLKKIATNEWVLFGSLEA